MSRSDRRSHWEQVYSGRAPDEVSWHQERPESSLRLIDGIGLGSDAAIIDVGGGASRLVDHLVGLGFRHVSVLDIAQAALDEARARLGARAGGVHWICGDVTTEDVGGPYDLWHDRAVFHFLTDPEDRRRYREQLERALPAGGHLIVAAFALDGPEKCSGLPVARYSPETMAAELGAAFERVDDFHEDHVTPAGGTQRFLFCHFRRR